MVDYLAILDEAKGLTTKIRSLDTIITEQKITAIEGIEVQLTSTQLQSFISKRAEYKTRKDEICDTVKIL